MVQNRERLPRDPHGPLRLPGHAKHKGSAAVLPCAHLFLVCGYTHSGQRLARPASNNFWLKSVLISETVETINAAHPGAVMRETLQVPPPEEISPDKGL